MHNMYVLKVSMMNRTLLREKVWFWVHGKTPGHAGLTAAVSPVAGDLSDHRSENPWYRFPVNRERL